MADDCFPMLCWFLPYHSSTLAWKFSRTEAGRLQSMGLRKVRHDWACTHTHTHTHNIMIKYHCCCGIAPEDNWSQVLQFNVKSWTLPAECLAPTSRLPEHRLSLLYVDTKLQNSKMRPGLSLLLSVRHHESGGGTWKIAPLSLTPGFGGAHISTS